MKAGAGVEGVEGMVEDMAEDMAGIKSIKNDVRNE